MEEMHEVALTEGHFTDDRERVLLGGCPRFAVCQCIYPKDGPQRVVCSIFQPRVYLLGGVKTSLKNGNDCIVWWFNVGLVLKPPNCACEPDSGLNCLWVGDVPEDP